MEADREQVAQAAAAIHKLICRAAELCDGGTEWDFELARAAPADVQDAAGQDAARRPAADKRDECGCHRECYGLPHECEKPCLWPGCLTPAEQDALAAEVTDLI